MERGACLRCLLAESQTIAPIGRRPMWEETDEIDNCLRILDDFALLQSLGRGGMGEVFLARQLSTGRLVAVKCLSPQVDRGRTDREAAALAALAHPHIVGILHRGEHDGCTYLVMDYVEGGSLADRIRSAPLSVRDCVRLMSSTARALAHAHERGILHRDLKPHNILLDTRGEPHLTDFGLAHLDTQPTLTGPHGMLGTPSYAAPEQLDPTLGPVSPRTDVYGLGATLYHLLTGIPPFQGESLQQTCHQVLTAAPASPRQLNSALPLDLEVICLACLEKSPQQRYRSADELADDLDRWLDHRPILRRPASTGERLLRWAQRHPSSAALSVVMLLVTFLGIIGVLWQWTQTRQANRRLETEISRARRELAEQHFRSGDTPEGLRVLSRHLREQPNDRSAVHRLWAALSRRGWALPHLAVQVPDLIAASLLHPDEEQLLLLTAKAVTAPSFDLQILNGRSKQRSMDPITLRGRSGNWGFSPNGGTLATLFDGQFRMWDTSAWAPIEMAPTPAPTILEFSWHPNLPTFFWGEGTNVLGAPLQKGTATKRGGFIRFPSPTNVTSLSLAIDGKILAVGDAQGTVRTWDVESGQRTLELRTGDGAIEAVGMMLSPPRMLATFKGVSSVGQSTQRKAPRVTGLWAWPSGNPVAFFTNSTLTSASLTTNWVTLAAGAGLLLVETAQGKLIKEWTNAVSPGFTADGRYLGMVEEQARFIWIDAGTLKPIGEPVRYPWPLELPAFALQSPKVVIPTSRGDATVWSLPRTNALPVQLGKSVVRFANHPREPATLAAEGRQVRWVDSSILTNRSAQLGEPILSLAIDPPGDRVIVGGERGRFSLLDARSLNVTWERTAGSNGIFQVAFSSDGTQVAGGDLLGMLYQWSTTGTNARPVSMDLSQGAPRVYGRHDVHAIRYHPQRPQVAVACGNGIVYLIAAGTTNVIHRIPHDDVPVFDVRFTPDGSRFAIASFRGYAQVYETQSGRPVGPKLSHDSAVMSLDFSPDGKLLLTGSDDQRARVWEVASGRVVSVAQGHTRTVLRVAFSPNGDRFLTSAGDGTARIWETATGLPLDEPLPHGSRGSTLVSWQGPNAVAVLAPGNPVLRYELPAFQDPAPSWFITLAESLSGLASNLTPAEELLKLRMSLPQSAQPSSWESWGRSLLGP